MHNLLDPLSLSAVALDVLAVQRGSVQGLEARQRLRLAHVLDAALRGSRLYREHWPRGATAATPLAALPMVSRGQLMGSFADWVTDPQLELAALRAFTADPQRIAEPWLGRYLVWESSGTSGEPGIFVQDAQAMAVYDALEALRRAPPQALRRWFDPWYLSERSAFIGATSGHFASYVSFRRLCALNPWLAASMRSFSIQQPLAELVCALNDFAPTVLATYPTVASVLADEAEQGRLRIAPREIWLGGETLGAAARAHITEALGGAVRCSYGASEFLSMAWECAHGQLHLNADWVILEPVDERFRPVPAGQPSCSVLLTNLANRVQPLVRCDLGDQVTLHAEPCACGSPLPALTVQGRQDEPLVMAGRDGQPVTLLPMAVSTVLEEEAGVFDFHLRQQDAHTLVLRLGLQGADGQAALARCSAALEAFAAAQGVERLRVRGQLGQAMPRGRSGKACRIVACATPRKVPGAAAMPGATDGGQPAR
ncbi:phenylacetate--CoA ligase family protein [Extensimonas sp. H3M7-6]|uniref:phenylacetate--CoA ligase family protein n=1 Tax=Extensimonas soli TaxID=3031322 RepID=UPI0023DC4AD4|nr:phenylacetate--CoA ligase family protein [Extensimonas sp. H3M7-6]MDF1481425.1 phenylacetate--CoA ligase family protein [Extensimonas sp. H3M7-6]